METERLAAVIRLVVTLIVTTASMLGYALDADALYSVVSTIAAAALIVWAWWRNNNITLAAQEGQKLTDALKAEKKAQKYEDNN